MIPVRFLNSSLFYNICNCSFLQLPFLSGKFLPSWQGVKGEYLVTDMNSSQSQENIGTLGSAHRTCVQPLDEKSIWEFFVPAACEHREDHRPADPQGRNIDTNTALHTKRVDCSWECDANEGIPPCLGARLSRGLGDSDFFRIDTNDLYASAAADARLAQVFALLQKPIEETLNREVPLATETGYQLVQPRPCAGVTSMKRTAAQHYESKDASTPLPHDVGSSDFKTSSMPKDNSHFSQYCNIMYTPKEKGILKMRRRSCEPNASELLSRTSSTASNSSTSLKVAPMFQPSMYPPSPIPAVVFNVFSVHKFRSEKRQFRSHESRQSCAG